MNRKLQEEVLYHTCQMEHSPSADLGRSRRHWALCRPTSPTCAAIRRKVRHGTGLDGREQGVDGCSFIPGSGAAPRHPVCQPHAAVGPAGRGTAPPLRAAPGRRTRPRSARPCSAIIDKAFDTERWAHFGWPAPFADPLLAMGLEVTATRGTSRRSTTVMAPLYRLLPGTVLDKFPMRCAGPRWRFPPLRVHRLPRQSTAGGDAVAPPYLDRCSWPSSRSARPPSAAQQRRRPEVAALHSWVCTLIAQA